MFKGCMVAIITPMDEHGNIDRKAFQNLIEWHIDSGTTAIVVAGTTGESPTIEADEHYELIGLAVKQSAGRVPIIAGVGTNSTKSTSKLAENAKRARADATLIVTPYYNKPPQNGLYEHYRYIAEKIDLPHILYNVPGRTSCDLLPQTVERLSKIKNIIGIKEATGNIDRTKEILQLCDTQFKIYSGDDLTAMELMLNGAHGVISVTANIAPNKMAQMTNAAINGKRADAEKLNQELELLHKNLFLEANPIPSKWALHKLGMVKKGIRLPLVPLDSKHHQAVEQAMHQAGVLSHEYS